MSLPEVPAAGRQLAGAAATGSKFRKQFPIGEMTVDFACLEHG